MIMNVNLFKLTEKISTDAALWIVKHKKILLAALLVVLIIIPQMPLSPYAIRICTLIMLYASLAVSLNLITGYTGQVSLGHAMFFGIGAGEDCPGLHTAGYAFDDRIIPGAVSAFMALLD